MKRPSADHGPGPRRVPGPAVHASATGSSAGSSPACSGIFGHGNVAGIGQALQQAGDRLRYYQCRNEQAMVHSAAAFAKMANRLATFACTTSIGPGATNMITGAAARDHQPPAGAAAARRHLRHARSVAPVLQQLESAVVARTSRSTTASSPSRATGTASTAPSSS